jgi:hypothetical protein
MIALGQFWTKAFAVIPQPLKALCGRDPSSVEDKLLHCQIELIEMENLNPQVFYTTVQFS